MSSAQIAPSPSASPMNNDRHHAGLLASIFELPYRAPSPADKYRGAVVEDLQLPPAFCISKRERIERAIEFAYERDFSHIPCVLPMSID